MSGVYLPSTGVSLGYEKYLFRHISSETDLLVPKDRLRRLERVFFVATVFVKRWKITKKDI